MDWWCLKLDGFKWAISQTIVIRSRCSTQEGLVSKVGWPDDPRSSTTHISHVPQTQLKVCCSPPIPSASTAKSFCRKGCDGLWWCWLEKRVESTWKLCFFSSVFVTFETLKYFKRWLRFQLVNSRCVWKMRRNLHIVVVGHQGLSPRSAGNWMMTTVKGRLSSRRRTGDWELWG